MNATHRTIEDPYAIRMMLQRLVNAGLKVALGCKDKRGLFQILFQDQGRIGVRLPPQDLEAWQLGGTESVSLAFEDRGFRFEAVVTCMGGTELDGVACVAFTLPRSVRRADDNLLAHFAPTDEGRAAVLTLGFDPILWGTLMPILRLLEL